MQLSLHLLSAHFVSSNVQTLHRLSLGSELLESSEFVFPEAEEMTGFSFQVLSRLE